MQKIGNITSTADANGEWTNGNVAAGTAPTIIDAAWLNTIQRELAGIVTGGGLALNPTNDAQVLTAIKKLFLQTLNNLSEVKAAGAAAQSAARTNLGLGSASVVNVGAGAGMVPDMSSFTSGASGASFWQKLPSGMLMQYGYVFNMSSGAITINYPVPFASQLRSLITTPTGNVNAGSINSAVPSLNPASGTPLNAFSVTGYNAPVGSGAQVSNVLFYWEAIGV